MAHFNGNVLLFLCWSFAFSLPSFLLQYNTKDVYWEQCFQMSPPHASSQIPPTLLIPGLVLADATQLHTPGMWPTLDAKKVSILHLSPNVSSNHGRRPRSEPRLREIRMMLSSDLTGLNWVNILYRVTHCMNCTLVCGISHVCKFMVCIFWELNYCIARVKYLYVLKICLRVHVPSSKTLVMEWRQQWVARVPHSFWHWGKNVSAGVWQLSPFTEQLN